MLVNLSIHNFAIIDELEIPFGPGFNVLTGETGAGKSIIIEALSTLLGQRVGSEVIRSGCKEARIEAVFTLPPELSSDHVSELLMESGMEADHGTLILTRELRREGANICRLNGRGSTLSSLSRVARSLVDIHAQGDHATLLSPKRQLQLLDRFAGAADLRSLFSERVRRFRHLQGQIERSRGDERELARRADRLRYELQEINAAKLRPGEDLELERELEILANAEKLIRLSDGVYRNLQCGNDQLPSAWDQVGEALRVLKQLSAIDRKLKQEVRTAEDISCLLEELGRTMRIYRDSIDYSPRRMDHVVERLELIHHLKRRYGDTIEEILAYGKKVVQELEGLSNQEERLSSLEKKKQEILSEITSMAGELSAVRRQAKSDLERHAREALKVLGMDRALFTVSLHHEDDIDGIEIEGRPLRLTETGVDRVEFLISAGPGEEPKPLRKIASSGELSRVMLALKSVLSQVDDVPTLVFDEIDSGIGARTGHRIGEKLFELGQGHQVICVTHLPQIAALAEWHARVQKKAIHGRTMVRASQLGAEERITELQEMIGNSATAGKRAAMQMFEATRQTRQKIVAAAWATPVLVDATSQLSKGGGNGRR